MKIRILCVGKLKEKYLFDAVKEYSKRISSYCDLYITEVQDEKTPDGASSLVEDKIKTTEGRRILKYIPEKSFVITLEIEGRMLDSIQFSDEISGLMLKGNSDITFIIGGSLGLSGEVLKRSDLALSFSKMTFPHQLMRVILLEQLYRAFRIKNKEPYHK